MGTQGFYGLPRRCRAGGRGHRAPLHAVVISFCLLPVMAGCSSNASWSSGSNQSAAVPRPTPMAAAVSQGAERSAGVPGYPQESLVDMFKQDAAATAAQPQLAPSPEGTRVTTSSAAPAQAQDMPHPPSTYTPSGQPYVPPQGQPTYSSATAQAAQRPPSAYTPSGQPYPPQGQPAAGPPRTPQAAADADEQSVPGYPTRSIFNLSH